LVMSADRQELSSDGEDVAMFAVEVQDAQGRVVPITDNEVTFSVSGQGKLIGTGNGDPTNHEADKGTSRRAFSGLCMAIVQSSKAAGNITVEATSQGLAPASVTITAKAATLRPQVAPWSREVPTGSGITGLWRPIPSIAGDTGSLALLRGAGSSAFTLRQDGNNLTGTVEGSGAGFFSGADVPVPISDGKIDGAQVSFKAGNNTYTGTVKGEQIELQQTTGGGFPRPTPPKEEPGRPAVGPPPDGSDPSINASRFRPNPPIVLRRAQR
jgi:beta-galactosidase